jgi:hypothetical protein
VCGPSSAQESIANNEQSFANVLQSNYNTRFQDQSNTLQELNQSLSPIVAAGINQQGFSPEELSAMNTQAINASGAANRNAVQAAQLSPAFSSSSGLESGIAKQIRGGIAATEAGNLANNQLNITEQNYQQGRQNYLGATGALQALSDAYKPNSGDALTGMNQAFGSASEIQQMKNQEQGDIAGLIASAIPFAGQGIAGGLKALSGGGAGPGMAPGIGGDPSGALDPSLLASTEFAGI